MSAELEGKVAIITGAGKGLGQAIAERFGQAGATVVVSDINEAAARKVAGNIPGATAHTCDVRDEEQVKGLVDATVAEHGALHIMVPNAGVGSPMPLLHMDLAAWRKVLDVNLDGVSSASATPPPRSSRPGAARSSPSHRSPPPPDPP